MISVLMAAKTSTEYMPQAIGSLMGQSYTDWELIIGVNGLPKGSNAYHLAMDLTMFARWNKQTRARVLDLPDCPNKSAALNEMVQHAVGEYVAILDVDDLWHPLKLERQLPRLTQGCDVVGTQGEYFGTVSGGIGTPPGFVRLDYLRRQNGLLNSSVVLKRELARWEPLDEPLEDYELWLRLASEGRRLYNVAEALTFIRQHGQNWSAQGNWDEALAKLRARYGG